MSPSFEDDTRKYYQQYYTQTAMDRNDLRRPEVLFQTLACDASVISAVRTLPFSPEEARVLDVGCGSGASLFNLIRLGFDPAKMSGLDILEERIAEGRHRFPNMDLSQGDAREMKFASESFDLVYESTMFVTLNDEIATGIAAEMLRVTKPGGYILLIDWRYSRPGNTHYVGLSRKRMSSLFQCGTQTHIRSVHNGALAPPLGRMVSKYLPTLYFPIAHLCPPLVAQVTFVLQKSDRS